MQYITLKNLFEAYIQEHLQLSHPPELYVPVNYIMSLGGKRFRPILLLMAHSLYSKNPSEALSAAFSVELFHNFTLVHDDIMDNADTRRGAATVHRKWGINNAILVGDVMQILAYKHLAHSPENHLHSLLSVFNTTAIYLCEGQQMDVNFEQRMDVILPEYLKMIENKTAVLLGASLEMGGIIGGASFEERKHLYEFGRLCGIAFQLKDDLLDTFGETAEVGKKIGGDILQNKKTALYLKALEDERFKASLTQLYSVNEYSDKKIEEVRGMFKESGAKEFCENLVKHYTDEALIHINKIDKDTTELKDLALSLINRIY